MGSISHNIREDVPLEVDHGMKKTWFCRMIFLRAEVKGSGWKVWISISTVIIIVSSNDLINIYYVVVYNIYSNLKWLTPTHKIRNTSTSMSGVQSQFNGFFANVYSVFVREEVNCPLIDSRHPSSLGRKAKSVFFVGFCTTIRKPLPCFGATNRDDHPWLPLAWVVLVTLGSLVIHGT